MIELYDLTIDLIVSLMGIPQLIREIQALEKSLADAKISEAALGDRILEIDLEVSELRGQLTDTRGELKEVRDLLKELLGSEIVGIEPKINDPTTH